MTSYNNKIEISKNSVRKNNFLMFFLIFLLMVLLVTSVLIFNRFTYSSKNIKKISQNYELKFIDIYEKVPETQINPAEESYNNIVLNEQKENKESSTSNKVIEEKNVTSTNKKEETTTKTVTTKKTTSKNSYSLINSRNIKRYHKELLKEFKNVKTVSYKVKWGDTLWKIALKYNTTAHSIYVLNAFNDPNLIVTGQIIKVPVNFILKKKTTASILNRLINNKSSFYYHKYNKNLHSYNQITFIFDNKNIITIIFKNKELYLRTHFII